MNTDIVLVLAARALTSLISASVGVSTNTS